MTMDNFRGRLLTSVGITALVLAVLTAGILYFGSSISNTGATIARHQQELYDRSASLQALAGLQSAYNGEAKGDLDALEAYLPIEDQLINLARDLEFVAKKSNLDFGYVPLQDTPPQGDTPGTIQYQLTLGGTMASTLQFLQALHNFTYLNSVNSLTITQQGTRSQTTLQGQVYFRP